jgi:predicted deacylase
MTERKPGKYVENYFIPSSGTFNTVPPFSSSIVKGPECTVCSVRVVGNSSLPCIYIGGGTHGDEINGIAAILKIIEEISPEDLKGSLILVPIQNPLGFKYRSRLNPFDPIDPDWVHPGKPSGEYSKNVKKVLYQLAEEADCVIDLHTAGRGGVNNTMIYVPPETGDGQGKESLRLSVAFGGDQIIHGQKLDDYDWPVNYAMPFVFTRKGKTGIYAESGEGGATIPDEKSVAYFITGIYNVMKSLGMIDGDVLEQGKRKIVNPLEDDSVNVKSPVEGVFITSVEAGTMVERGVLLGKVYGIPSGVHEILAPRKGCISWRCSFGSVGRGGTLFSIS